MIGIGLDAGRIRANDTNAKAGEIHAFARPQTRVVPVAREGIQTLELWHIRQRQIAGGHDAELRGDKVALVGLDGPAVAAGVKLRRQDACIALDGIAQVELVGHVDRRL